MKIYTSDRFIVTGGTSSQFLKADGSIDSTIYYPTPTGTISQYLRGNGTLATFPTIPTVNPSALTKTDDTNVTLTLGGTPSTALLQGVSLTLGWTGTLADSRITSAATWNAKQAALSGTGLVKSTAGTISYITDNSTNWDSAYTNRITSITTTGSGAATLVSNILNIPTPVIPSVGTWGGLNYPTWSTGTPFVKMTAAGTFALDTNTYLTSVGIANLTATGTPSATTYLRGDNTWATVSGGGGSVTSVSFATGTTGTDVNSSVATATTTPAITLNIPTASATNRGALSSTDWTTFNGKQNALTNPVTGTGTVGYVSFWNATNTQIGSSNLFWDNTNKYLGIGTTTPQTQLHVRSATSVAIARIQGLGDVDNYSVLELWDDTGASKWQFAHKLSAGGIKDFSFAHWNGTSWIQPMRLKDSGRILLGVGTVDDGVTTNLVQSEGYVRAAGYKITGGLSTQYLMADGSTTTGGGGGGATPGGTVNEVQYNDGAGGFAGAANVEVDTGNLKLVTTAIEPSVPTGGLIFYSKSIAGRVLPKIIGPSGIDTVIQAGLHGNSVFLVSPANGTTAPNVTGGVIATATTISHQQTIASANPWQATRRTRFQTSTTINNASGMRTAYVQWFRGSVTGYGGFWFRSQLGQNININGGQKFVGLCASTGALAGEPSALLNMCGMGYDSTDLATGSWFFMYNDGTGTATKVDLGADAVRNTTHGYDLVMYMTPGGSELFVRITNLHTNVIVLDTSYTTLLPVVNTGMAFAAQVRTTTAAANNLEIAKVYIESDY